MHTHFTGSFVSKQNVLELFSRGRVMCCRSTQGELTNVLGALYATTLFFSIINATVIQPVIVGERAVSYRERAAGMYSILPWTMALVSLLAPLLVLQVADSASVMMRLLYLCMLVTHKCELHEQV